MTTLIDGTTKTTTWQYVYDGSDIAQEIYTKPDGTIENTWYTHGPGTDEHLAMERGGQHYYFHTDGLGSVTAITNESAVPVQTYNYDSYGVPKQSTSFRNSYQYTGREYDPEIGLYYNHARYYDQMEGRFISKDPISFSGGDVNLYGYVKNNPVNWIDPEGLMGTLPYLDKLGNGANSVLQALYGDGRPSKAVETAKFLFSKPPNDPLLIDPNNPAFKNYISPSKKQCPTKTNDFEKYFFNL
jgi:RHS repeat-associated protein